MLRSSRLFLVFAIPLLFAAPARAQDMVLGKTKNEWLTMLTSDDKPLNRKAAVLALSVLWLKDRDVLPVFIKALTSDKDEQVRLQIATVMSGLNAGPSGELRDALPTLADVLKEDKSAAVRAACASLMTKLGENARPALTRLIGALKDSDAGVRANAVEAIGKIGPEAKSAIPEILPLLKDADAGVRLNTVFACRGFGADAAVVVPDLLQVLEKDGSDDVRREVAKTLASIGASSAKLVLPALVKQMRDEKSAEVRRQLAQTLGKLGDIKTIVKDVFDLIKNEKDHTVRLYLARSIPGALSGGLQENVKDYAVWLGRDPDGEVRLALVQELGALGPAAKEALDALIAAESDVVIQVREAAREAVLQVKGLAKKEPKK